MSIISFLIYDSRSGSTIVAALLNQFDGICVTPESAFVNRIIAYNGNLNVKDLNNFLDYLYYELRFAEFNIPKKYLAEKILESKKKISKKTIIEIILKEFFKYTQYETNHYIIKFPPGNYLGIVKDMFPNVRFLHLIRDGRAVFNSKSKTKTIRRRKPMNNNLIKAAFQWKRQFKTYPQDNTIIKVRYEDILSNPDISLRLLLDFIGISDVSSIEKVKAKEDYFNKISDRQKVLHNNVNRPIDVTKINKWKEELSEEQIYLYELLVSKQLKENGYLMIEKGKAHSYSFYVKISFQFVYYLFHYIFDKLKNIWCAIFIEKDFLDKTKSRYILFYTIMKNKITEFYE